MNNQNDTKTILKGLKAHRARIDVNNTKRNKVAKSFSRYEKLAPPDLVDRVKKLVEMYKTGEIDNKLTVENILLKATSKDKRISKSGVSELQKLESKLENKAKVFYDAKATKIKKSLGSITKFTISDQELALNNNVISVTLKPKKIGVTSRKDIDSFIARSYLEAKKVAKIKGEFKVYAVATIPVDDADHFIKTKKYDSNQLGKFFAELRKRIYGEYKGPEADTMMFEYNFIKIPSGGARTTERDTNSILNKKSVLRIINDDNNCFWYALACLMNPENTALKDSRNKLARAKVASKICQKCKLQFDEKVSFNAIPFVEKTYNCNINILNLNDIPVLGASIDLMNCLMYKSENRGNNHYFLLYDDIHGHYDCITDIKAFLACKGFCFKCYRSFYKSEALTTHDCKIIKKSRQCKNENTMRKEAAHYLKRSFTKGSQGEIEDRYKKALSTYAKKHAEELGEMDPDELEYIQVENKFPSIARDIKEGIEDQIKQPKFIVYDFECDVHDKVHKPNHVEIDILQIDARGTHDYDKCLKQRHSFTGYGCEDQFGDWLFSEHNKDSTVIAHNGAGYDNKFILKYCLRKGLLPSSFIRQGSRISYMRFNKYNIRFVDSYHFFLQPLKNLSETYNIDTIKGYFPHYFNRPENQNYIGVIPSEDQYGAKNMMEYDYNNFKKWHDEQLPNGVIAQNWNFKEELVKYCRADVELLSKAILKFRLMFYKNLDTDPFRYTTLASLCMNIYMNKFLVENTIVGNNHEKKDSIISREWLLHLNNNNQNRICREVPKRAKPLAECNIHENKVDGDVKKYYECQPDKFFTVDGYDAKDKTIYEFQGCYWHGCRKCHPEQKIRYNKTMEKNNLLRASGYKVVEMWECEWTEFKKNLANASELEASARKQNINIRDALFGGRTEGFKIHVKTEGDQKLFYYDVVSLYPTVNALDDYAIGFGKYVDIKPEDILSGKFFGIVKCDVEPPKDLYVPVLPDNSGGKLLFHLEPMKDKTYASVEIKKALEKGYKIKIHSAIQYDKYKGLMKDYVEFFLKIKIENNQHYTKEECDEINKSHQAMGFSFKIESKNTSKNPGLKQVAKICLNSLWGKFGQRTTLDSYEYIKDWNSLLLKLTDDKVKTNSWHIIHSDCVELRYNDDVDYEIDAEYISEVTAVFTTANARMRLYSMLDWLDSSQIVYCDTDSVVFLYDPENPKHKYPSNKTKDLPSNIRFGNSLGEWEDEMKKGWEIKEMIIGGAKSYSYRKHNCKTNETEYVVKQKGITLDKDCASVFTFNNIKDMVLNNKTIESPKRFQFTYNSHTKDIETRYVSRTAKQTIDSKRVVVSNDTYPFGYEIKL